jgi:NTE family protein
MHPTRPASASSLTCSARSFVLGALAFCLAQSAPPVLAQAAGEVASKRPRIGLVLSGGGARGAAHIGVLKVLEELRVPVDCIAGTSMGAVVGGAFAAGTTPQAMQDLIARTDWDTVFTDSPPRAEILARRKQDDYKGLFAPEFGVRDGGLVVQSGVVAGVTIESFLRQLADPAVGINDFSRLPVPFRAVATDIVTGAPVVLEHGSLMLAMRASMAIPVAVAPVEIEGRLLVDGGIANNLPIDMVRGHCADVIIAVNISTPAMQRREITSALSMVGQLMNLLGKERVDQQLAAMTPRDVLVAPELGDISAASFERQLEAIAIGEQAARAAAQALRRYSLPPEDYAAVRLRQVRVGQALGQVDAVRFDGLQRTSPEVLESLVQSRPGTALDAATLAADMRRIYGRGDFEAVDYRIDRGPAGRTLVVPVREKSIGPDYLRFGLSLLSDFSEEHSYNVLFSYRRTWLNRRGGEWASELQVGRDTYAYTEFYQPLDHAQRFFVAPYARVGRSTAGIYVGDDRVATYRIGERRLGLDLGTALGTWGELRLGWLDRKVEGRVSTGDPVYPNLDDSTRGVRLQLFGDSHDAPWFPRSGTRVAASAFFATQTAQGAPSYHRLEGLWSGAYSVREHTMTLSAAGGTGAGTRLPVYDGFVLGGPFRLSGYAPGQFAGQNYAFGSVRYYNQRARLPTLLGTGAFIGASAEVGKVGHQYQGGSTGTLWSGSLFLAAETFLGPAFFGVGFGGGGHRALYLMLGAP